MARNCEKQYGRLNRTILAKEIEEFEKKHPKRPHLSNLHTADEIKCWLPSIKKDLDFNLKQSQVICYPDRKITELRTTVVQLEQDYKRFVRKMKQLDPAIKHVPWTDRPYEPKRTKIEDKLDLSNETTALILDEHSSISTPILDNIKSRKIDNLSVVDFNLTLQDLPLNFIITPEKLESSSLLNDNGKKEIRPRGKCTIVNEKVVRETEQTLKKIFGLTHTEFEDKESCTYNGNPTKLNLVDYTNDSDSSEKSD